MAEKWSLLRDGTAATTILAVDFQSARTEPALRDLMPHVDVAAPVWQPAAAELGTLAVPSGAYTGAWAGEVRRRGWKISGMLGYCGGGALALELARQLGVEPVVVLLDPYEVDAPMIGYQFLKGTEQFGAVLAEAEWAELRRWVWQLCQDASPPEAAGHLVHRYATLTHQAFAELGLDAQLEQEFADRFRRFAAYLVAAWRAGYHGSDDDTVVVLSQHQDLPTGLRGRVHRLPVTHDDLLTDPRAHALAKLAGSDA
jgi:hypothetical protein